MFDGKAFGDEIVAIVKSYLERETAGIATRLAAIEKRLDELPAPIVVDPAAITAQVRGEIEAELTSIRTIAQAGPSEVVIKDWIAQAILELPEPTPGEPGKSVTADECLPAIIAAVEKAVSSIPAPKDGDPGKSVSIEDVRPLIAEAALAELASWERPKDGDPGKSVTVDDVAPLVERIVNERLAEAVAAIPPAAPGKDADPATIVEMVHQAVAALPPAQPGKDADPELVARLVDETVRAAVAALPVPKDGEPGKLPIVKAWSDEVHYAGEVRTHAGSTYQAQRDTAKEPPHTDWICIARGGADGRSFAVRGTWQTEESYQALNVVALNGAAFVARRDAPGPCPGDGWQMIASQGKPGKPGPALKGDPGPAGKPVVAMSINDEGMLTLTNGDGSTIDCDLYPLLSKLGQ